ncbi:alpha-N-acetylgalactosaminide alpha-2,6-sialyltransferase 2-like [Periophthalmus magnuspinnatus]|uniref:alpha-N-acetylgalactosaminide alpha-2,6-sialyltransferase 2-like n=1 Tax=Periophthalmus magnuspinnatus TaxID=409849 RepID=UPI00145B6D5A|nr:alpha-N-acetylgalactosaminide alpha-2,6-sialyltransferase 2-like [Periophthalmus magnuspinnatus]
MARQAASYARPVFLLTALVTILYISWLSMSGCMRVPVYYRAISQQQGPKSSTTPPTTTDPPGLTPIPILHRKNYSKLPEWDFDDKYRTDRRPHKTTQKCDSSLWRRIPSEPELRDKFIPNLRMYVYNGSISMSEWNRLSHFNNPFGFMDYRHQDVMAGLSLVQKPKEPLLLPKPGRDCITCAVVANGGVLWRSKKGAEIDSHDYVFRVNGAVIKGFEEDVGNRTDVYVHTAHSITASEIIFRKYNYIRAPHDPGIKYVLIPEGMRDFEWLTGLYKRERLTSGSYKGRRPWTQYSGQFNETRFYVLHMDFLRYVRNRFLKSPTLNHGYWSIVRPTNGAFMMFLALQLCDRVDAYGFITEDHKKYSNYYFERGANTHIVFYANHNYILESTVWRRLHDLGIINLYLGKPQEPTQRPPKETQSPPKDAQAPPKDAQGPPKGAQAPPKYAQAPPKDAQGPPKDAQAPPKDEKAPPKDAQAPPKDEKAPPKDAQAPPKDAQGLPKDEKAPPKDAQGPPKDEKAPPKDAQAPPKDEKAPPKDAQAPPKDKQAPPKDAQGPPRDAQKTNTTKT